MPTSMHCGQVFRGEFRKNLSVSYPVYVSSSIIYALVILSLLEHLVKTWASCARIIKVVHKECLLFSTQPIIDTILKILATTKEYHAIVWSGYRTLQLALYSLKFSRLEITASKIFSPKISFSRPMHKFTTKVAWKFYPQKFNFEQNLAKPQNIYPSKILGYIHVQYTKIIKH